MASRFDRRRGRENRKKDGVPIPVGAAWKPCGDIRPFDVFLNGCAIENGWCFISWNSKWMTNKIPQSWSPPAENLDKKHIFSMYYWDKTTMYYDRAFLNGCVIENGRCFISWNSKWITNKIPQSWSPPAENWKKAYIFQYCRDKTTMCYDGAF